MNPPPIILPFGVGTWADLSAHGVTQGQVRKALKTGELRQPRRGWYATRSADAKVVAALAADGVLSCLDALRILGVWVPDHRKQLHVRARESAHRKHGSARYCRCYGPPTPEAGAVDDIRTAYRHALKCLDPEGIVVISDSILRQNLLEMCDLEELMASAPRRIRRLLARCDTSAESGTGTMVRLRLQGKGIKFRTQVMIPGLGRVDFLIGDRLIIEVDSEEFHDRSAAQRARDRRRDEKAFKLGYFPLRMDYKRVVYEWDDIEESIDELIRRREHLRKLPA